MRKWRFAQERGGIEESESLCKKEKMGSEKVKVDISGWKWLRDSESRYEKSEKGFAKVEVERSTLSKSAISEIWFQRFVITSLFLAYLRYHISIVIESNQLILNLDKLDSVALTFLGSNFPFPPWLCFLLPGTEDKKMILFASRKCHEIKMVTFILYHYLKIIFVKNSISVIVVHVPEKSLNAMMIRKNYQKSKKTQPLIMHFETHLTINLTRFFQLLAIFAALKFYHRVCGKFKEKLHFFFLMSAPVSLYTSVS